MIRILPIVMMTGCVSAPVAPNLKLPEMACAKLQMPAIPKDVEIEIHGDDVTTNPAGTDLLRAYVKARDLLK